MGAAGASCSKVSRGNSVRPQLLGLDRLVPGEKGKGGWCIRGGSALEEKLKVTDVSRVWCYSQRLLGLGIRGHSPDSSCPRWVSATARTMWLMSGPNMKTWMGISTRYLKGGGE